MASFVRDAVGLVVPAASGLPPALNGPVAGRRAVLSDPDRADASVQWVPWWQQILEVAFGVKRGLRLSAGEERASEVVAAVRSVSDPPEFTALADVPQLRAAVRASFDDFSQWQRHRVSRLEAGSNVDVVKQAVDDVAFDREVPVEALNGTIVVLPVTGVWWRRIAPGQILCSDTARAGLSEFRCKWPDTPTRLSWQERVDDDRDTAEHVCIGEGGRGAAEGAGARQARPSQLPEGFQRPSAEELEWLGSWCGPRGSAGLR